MKRKIMLFLSVMLFLLIIPVSGSVHAEERITANPQVTKKVSEIAAACVASGANTEYDKAVWLHDWLTRNANYDYTFTEYGPEGVLLKGTGVCQSYTEAYKLLLDAFGIENIIVEAPEMPDGGHAWNIVKLNGKYCHVDCTWDDPGRGGAEGYTYFGMNDTLMARDHQWNRKAYPACSSLDNYYPARKGYTLVNDSGELNTYLNSASAAQKTKLDIYYIGTDKNFNIQKEYETWFQNYAGKYSIASVKYAISGSRLQVTAEYDGQCTNGHAFGAYKETKKPTAVSTGIKTRQCSKCGKVEEVSVPRIKAAMKLNVSSIVLKRGQKYKALKVTGLAAGDKVASYKSSKKKIFTVSKTGVITAGKKDGTAKLTITLKSGYSKTIKVKVQKKAVKTTGISGVKKNLDLKKGDKYTLKPVITPAGSVEKVTFTSSNKKIAAVSSKGVIKAKKKGTVKITVKSGKKKVICKIKIK